MSYCCVGASAGAVLIYKTENSEQFGVYCLYITGLKHTDDGLKHAGDTQWLESLVKESIKLD